MSDSSPIVQPKSVLIVEDDRAYQDRFKVACETLNWNIIGIVADKSSALHALERDKPDVVLLDLFLPPESAKPEEDDINEGMDLLNALAEHKSKRKFTVIIITRVAKEWAFRRAAAIPVSFLVKATCSDPEILTACLALAARDFVIFDRPVASYLSSSFEVSLSIAGLSQREKQICEMLSDGDAPKEIAQKINRDVKTVYVFIKGAKSKLGLKEDGSTVDLVNEYRRRLEG